MYSDADDHKMQSAARRKVWLQLHRDGVNYADRVHRPKSDYQRRPKHRPKTIDDWEDD